MHQHLHLSWVWVGTVVISAMVVFGVGCDIAKALKNRPKRDRVQEWWDKRLSESCLVCGAKPGEYCNQQTHTMHIDRVVGKDYEA